MATITVTNANDSGPGSLRDAIGASNSGDTIVFASFLTGSTITVLTPLVLNKGITIDGTEPGQNVVVSGGGTTTVFDVTGSSVTLQGLAISNGRGTGTLGLNTGGDAAGGIFVESGSLVLATDTFINNTALGGGAVALNGTGGNAAGAYYVEPGASVIAAGLSFFGNSAAGGTGGIGGTNGVGYPITNTPACFCHGTLIATDRGDVPVEQLAIGDLVVTVRGTMEAIRWIGHRNYGGRFLAANPGMKPVLIRAGSLGEDLPRRDLRVSPSHAMYMDGVLVPASALVNGISIVLEREVDRVDYIHIELASHEVILAEGAPSETFLDDDSRGMFHNAAEYTALYGPGTSAGGFFARRVTSGFELEATRARLNAIAGARALAA